MFIDQLSVFLENKPGRLAEITGVLKKNSVDIRAVTIADTTQFGILRIIVDQPKKAEAALKEQGFTVSLTKVIAIGIDDTPGGLHSAMLALDEAGVSVDYLYAFISRSEPMASVILRVSNPEKAEEALRKHAVKMNPPEEVYAK